MLRGLDQALQIVTHDAFEDHFDAQVVDLFGEIKRIGICAEGCEQFGANRNDLGVHG